ncbi:hypothetical protein ciss_24770 [Carboxydothermus islandicus]|uniref:Lipoprotein n=1 Tax=Carboxydothermus islandicus TaxID=661089 RepID=A0A1L8D616_9THEO|nr:hypothetical protein [Carboxydothermus islandicus]GAV26544.1 hypothetical protein ciss_24770 [Carboxydothermus islandicus]
MQNKHKKKFIIALFISTALIFTSGCEVNLEQIKTKSTAWIDKAANFVASIVNKNKDREIKNPKQLSSEELKILNEELESYRETLVSLILNNDREGFKNELSQPNINYDFNKLTTFFKTNPTPLLANVLADGTGSISYKGKKEKCVFIVKKINGELKITKIYFQKVRN